MDGQGSALRNHHVNRRLCHWWNAIRDVPFLRQDYLEIGTQLLNKLKTRLFDYIIMIMGNVQLRNYGYFYGLKISEI